MTATAPKLRSTIWHGAYGVGWGDMICPESYSHPAKYSRRLIEKIIATMLSRGWITPGQTILDPFGGIASGGIVAGYHGLGFFGIELEPRFCELGNRNLDLHRANWRKLGLSAEVRLVRGDSRRLREIVGGVTACVTSPPFMDNNTNIGAVGDTPAMRQQIHNSAPREQSYGGTAGQLGNTSGETYWLAVRDIYAACYDVLRPGSYTAIVVKAYVKAKKIVDLPGDTLRLLTHIGFEPVEHVKAMLVAEHGQMLIGGGEHRLKRASFFRRLAEKKGSPSIDHEDVLICRKPASIAKRNSQVTQRP